MSNDNTVATIANTTSTPGGKWVARYEERRIFIESKEKTSTGNTKRLPVKHRKIILEHTAGDRPAIEFGVTKTQYGWSIRDHRPMVKEVKKTWESTVVIDGKLYTRANGNMKPRMVVVKQDKGEAMGWESWKALVRHMIGEDRADELRVQAVYGIEVKYGTDATTE